MEGPISSEKYTLPKFAKDLQVVLVDHDLKSLTKIMGKLMKFSFQVTPVNLASKALSMIRENKTRYDLVVADINLQDMNYRSFGHGLCQSEIPIIWMLPSDDRAEEALRYGYYIKKPISSNDLKYLFQHAFRRKGNQKESHGIEVGEAGGASGSAASLGIQNRRVVQKEQKRLIDDQQGNMQDKRIRYTSESILELQELNYQNERGRMGDGNRNAKRNESGRRGDGNRNAKRNESGRRGYGNRNAKRNESGRRGDGNRNAKRRPHLSKGRPCPVWNPLLKSKFEAAIRELGDRAKAKSIYEKMNDRSITLKQVASHFQKFKSSAQKKNVDSGATSLPVTNNSSSSLTRHPGKRHQSQLPEGGVAGTTEVVGSVQGEITSGTANNAALAVIFNFDETVDLKSILNSQNPGDIEQNQEPMGEQARAAVSSNHGFSFGDNEEDGFINMERFESCHGVYGEWPLDGFEF